MSVYYSILTFEVSILCSGCLLVVGEGPDKLKRGAAGGFEEMSE